MSRSRRFMANTVMGYTLIAANLLYTLLSVPLALRYLGKEEFGLWALALQITGYLMLLDLGLASALSRFLADSKDNPEKPEYAKVFVIGCIVFCVQGLIIALAGSAFAFFAPMFFGLSDTLAHAFRNVLIILSIVSGLSVVSRAFGSPLWAFQRLDITYVLGIFALISSILMLWIGFVAGWGIYSFAVASVPSLILNPVITFFICRKNKFYPTKLYLRAFDWPMFRRIFAFGKDVLLMSLGSQLVNASQVIILSRFVSLEAAATFAIGTKFFAMGQQFTGRIIESSAPGLTELYVQLNYDRFRHSFRRILSLTGFLASILGIMMIGGNTLIVSIWTSGKIQWSTHWDFLLALLLVFTSASRCVVAIFGVVAKLQPVRNVYFLEACLFIVIAVPASSRFGIAGILVSSLLAHIAITTIIPIKAARIYLERNSGFFPMLWISTLIVSVVYLGSFPWYGNVQQSLAAIISRAIILIIGLIVSWWLLLSASLRSQILTSGMRLVSLTLR